MKKAQLVLLFLIYSFFANAQENETIKNTFKGTRFVNAQSANLAEKGKLLLQIQHRFGDISGGAYELFGLDQASMRLGFEYGFSDNLNFGIGRSTFLKTYDAFGKFQIVKQSSNFPLNIVFTAGGSLPTIRNFFPETNDGFLDKSSGNVQLHFAKSFDKFGFQLSPGYLKSGYLPVLSKSVSSYTMGFGGSLKFSKKVALNLEYLHNFNENLTNKRPLSLGLDLDTGGHLFQLVVSNSQRMFEQAVYSNTANDWLSGNLFFGFNLIREFNIKYY